MENKRVSLESQVRSRCSKLKHALKRIEEKGSLKNIAKGRTQKKFRPNCARVIEEEDRCYDIKVTEFYDEVLDLRKIFGGDEVENGKKSKNADKNVSVNEQNFLDQVCEFPNMHYKIMILSSGKNSGMFNEQFNTKTDIISERIVNKQLELQAREKSPQRIKPKIPTKVGEMIVIQKIIEKEKELQQQKFNKSKKREEPLNDSDTNFYEEDVTNVNSKTEIIKSKVNQPKMPTSRPRFQLSTKPEPKKPVPPKALDKFRAKTNFCASLKNKINRTETKGSIGNSSEQFMASVNLDVEKSNLSKRCTELVNRLNNCNVTKKSMPVSHSSIQVSTEKSLSSICTQTSQMNRMKNVLVQTSHRSVKSVKKMQTRLFKTFSAETSPIPIEGTTKCTNTLSEYSYSEHPGQVHEHLTINDLVCLDWVNKHLFGVTVSPQNIVVDDRIREVSEVASKSTFLSEIESLALPT